MELRQLQAFEAVASELHFGRAAERLLMAQPTLSELVARLERELGTQLLTRTTRRVALTAAGSELLTRARAILADVDAAAGAVRRVAAGAAGQVRVGLTPPAAPVLGPHLRDAYAAAVPGVSVVCERMWLPALLSALLDGSVDVGLTCGKVAVPQGLSTRVLCRERISVALRPGHRLAGSGSLRLADLAGETLGRPRASLFPAWALAQRQVLARAGVDPPVVDLDDADLDAARWQEQDGVDWVLLLGSSALRHPGAVVRPLPDEDAVPYLMIWRGQPAPEAVVRGYLDLAPTLVPPGWLSQPA